MAIPEPTRCCFYFIEEGTKNEHVAVGSNGNILRWKNTNGTEQQWLIIPISDQKCKIMTRQNGEFMAVGSNGNILRWANTNGPEQEFSFVNQDSSGRWNIQESTKNEFVAVGWDGNILRWAQSNKNDQRFKLVAADEQPKPEVQPGKYLPGQIPGAPEITAWDQAPPERSDFYLIGEMTVPAVLVNDGGFSGKVPQVETTPYYVLSRHQYWDRSSGRGFYNQYEEAAERTQQYTLKVGLTEKESTEIERTLTIKITEKGDFSFDVSGIEVAGVKLGFKGSASIQREFEDKLRVKTSTETTSVTEETRVVTIKIPPGKHARVMWTLVDRYTLKRYDGTQIGVWEVASKTVTDEQNFSPPVIILDPIEDPVSPLIDTTAPRVTSVTPADDRKNVALNTNITATFSETMDPTTINESTFQLFKLDHNRAPARITNVAVSLSPDGLTATLNPFGQSSKRLEKNTRYRAVITTGVKDLAGNTLDQVQDTQDSENKVWTFRTRD